MKTIFCLASGLCVLLTTGCVGAPSALAEAPVPVVVAPPPAEPGTMDELVAPIALYPDALVALILPASTISSDIVLAARYLSADGDRGQFESQPWDDSVKALAHYPDVVNWMDENLEWTQRLGEAYMDQPQEVMAAIQRDRARARANGILVDTQQQQIVVEDDSIRIIPAQRDVIYVPRYDPQIVYVDRPVHYWSDPWLTFGIGFGVGSWLAYDLDWRAHTIWVHHYHHRHARWNAHPDWRHPHFPGRPGYVHRPGWDRWKPAPGRMPPPHRRHFDPGHRNVPRPSPIAGAPRFDRDHRHPGPWRPNRDAVRPDRIHRDGPRPDRGDNVAGEPKPPRVRRPGQGPIPNPALGPTRGEGASLAPARRSPRTPEQNRDHADRVQRRDPVNAQPGMRGPAERRVDRRDAQARVQPRTAPAIAPAQSPTPSASVSAPAVRTQPRLQQHVQRSGSNPAAVRAPRPAGAPPALSRGGPAQMPPRQVHATPPPAASVPQAAPAVRQSAPAQGRSVESRPAPAMRQERSESRPERSGGGGGPQGRGGRDVRAVER